LIDDYLLGCKRMEVTSIYLTCTLLADTLRSVCCVCVRIVVGRAKVR